MAPAITIPDGLTVAAFLALSDERDSYQRRLIDAERSGFRRGWLAGIEHERQAAEDREARAAAESALWELAR